VIAWSELELAPFNRPLTICSRKASKQSLATISMLKSSIKSSVWRTIITVPHTVPCITDAAPWERWELLGSLNSVWKISKHARGLRLRGVHVGLAFSSSRHPQIKSLELLKQLIYRGRITLQTPQELSLREPPGSL
jgi:hypothetical protein